MLSCAVGEASTFCKCTDCLVDKVQNFVEEKELQRVKDDPEIRRCFDWEAEFRERKKSVRFSSGRNSVVTHGINFAGDSGGQIGILAAMAPSVWYC